MKRAKTVDQYIEEHSEWRSGLEKLRTIALSCELDECIKWGSPVYTLDGKNIVGLGAFKGYFGLWFFQGALIDDTANVLINAQEGKTRALRQWRMTRVRDIKVRTVRSYIRQAMTAQKEGRAIRPRRNEELSVPTELGRALRAKRATKAFNALSPGKQREYARYVAEAKRAETRERRAEKSVPMILAGTGLNDRYRNC